MVEPYRTGRPLGKNCTFWDVNLAPAHKHHADRVIRGAELRLHRPAVPAESDRGATVASWALDVLGDALANVYGSAEPLENILDEEKATDPIGHAVRHLMNDLANLQKAYTAARSEILQ